MTDKKQILKISIYILATTLVLILGTIFDLSISKSLCILPVGEYYCQNFFVAICEIFGEAVLFVLLILSFAIIFNYFLKKQIKNNKLKIFALICSAILGTVVSLFFVYKTLEFSLIYFSQGFRQFADGLFGKAMFAILGLILCFVVFALTNKIKFETLKNLFKWAIIIIAVSIVSNGLVKVLKIIIKRMRFRAMLYVGDTSFNYFTNWFEINKNTFPTLVSFGEDFFKSFPSGHACASASMFNLCLLPKFLNKQNNKKLKISLLIVSIVYTFLICFSRVLCGAHFFTDVFVGALICVASIPLVNIIFNKIFSKTIDKQKQ